MSNQPFYLASPLEKDLRVITGASTGADGGNVAGAVTEAGGPFVVQKFVKSRGPHAFIVRQVKYSRTVVADKRARDL